MRLLFLSNTQGNTNPEVITTLKKWLNPTAKIAYFSASPDKPKKYFTDVAQWYESAIGVNKLVYLDANSTSERIAELNHDYNGIHLSGGNTYHLLQSLRNTGVGEIVRKLALETNLPIIGVSAGGLCLTRDIRAATVENDIGLTDFSGLGIVNFGFYPHYKPDDFCRNEITSFMGLTNIDEVLALPEYSGLTVTDEKCNPLGEVIRFKRGASESPLQEDLLQNAK